MSDDGCLVEIAAAIVCAFSLLGVWVAIVWCLEHVKIT